MSRNRKNNHYRYAEKYSDKRRGQVSARDVLRIPRKSAIFALVILVLFGLISTTFASFVSETYDDVVTDNGEPQVIEYDVDDLISNVRTRHVQEDTLPGGANREFVRTSAVKDLAATGASTTVYFINTLGWSNVYVCFLTSSYWDNDIGTGSYGYNNASQGFIQMTEKWAGSGVYYATYSGTTSAYINFVKDNQNNYGNYYNTQAVYRGDFSTTNPTFVPSTTSNTSKNGTTYYSDGEWKAAPSSTNTMTYNLYGTQDGESSSTNFKFLQSDIANNNYTDSYAASETNEYKVVYEKTYTIGTDVYSFGTRTWYGNSTAISAPPTSSASVTRTLSDTGNNVSVTNGALGGSVSFSFASGTKVLTVTFPTYTMGISNTHTGSYSATFAPTVGGSTTSATGYQGGSVSYRAETPTGYNFTGWRLIAGSVKIGSTTYSSPSSSTNISTTANITVYPVGNAASITLRAVYTVKKFTVTYKDYDGTTLATLSNVEYGTALGSGSTYTNAPSTPAHDDMTFSDWDKAVSYTVTADTTVTAQYSITAPSFEYWMEGTGVGGGTGSAAGDRIEFPATSSDIYLKGHVTGSAYTSTYSYKWSVDGGSTYTAAVQNDGVGDYLYYSSQSGVTQKTGGTNAAVGDYQITLICKKYVTGYESTLYVTQSATVYYKITNNYISIRDFAFNPDQKIYSITSAASALFSMNLDHSGTSFDFDVYASTTNNNDFVKTGTYQQNSVTVDPATINFNIATYVNTLPNIFTNRGVKFLYVTANDTSRNDGEGKSYTTSVITTAVGTKTTAGARPYYFKTTDLDLSDYRVMAIYRTGGATDYQTAQTVSTTGSSTIYRVQIPSDTTNLVFAACLKTRYKIPDYSSGFTMSSDYFPYYTTAVNPFDSGNVGKNMFVKTAHGGGGTDAGLTDQSSGNPDLVFYEITGSLEAY